MITHIQNLPAFYALPPERKALIRAIELVQAWKKKEYEDIQISANMCKDGNYRLYFAEIKENTLIKHDAESFTKHHPRMRWKTFLLKQAIRSLRDATLNVDPYTAIFLGKNTRILEYNPNAKRSYIEKTFPILNHLLSKNPLQIIVKECSAHQRMEYIEKYNVDPTIIPEFFHLIQTKENAFLVYLENDLYVIFEENSDLSHEKFGLHLFCPYEKFQDLSTPSTGKTSPYFIRDIGVSSEKI